MRAELAGRSLQGGEPGGYLVRCALDRFAMRWNVDGLARTSAMMALYADLSCTVERAADHAPAWRGELRGRAAAIGPDILAADVGLKQVLADQLMSDVSRELASDLAVRVLGLTGSPSLHVYANEKERVDGVDDWPQIGAIALEESAEHVGPLLAKLHELRAPDATRLRTAAWNGVAMTAGPGEEWPVGWPIQFDDEPIVRFYQYKALARSGSPQALGEMRKALAHEEDSLCTELLRDSLTSDGIGVARARPRGGLPSGTGALP
jgi:hypothetical protein